MKRALIIAGAILIALPFVALYIAIAVRAFVGAYHRVRGTAPLFPGDMDNSNLCMFLFLIITGAALMAGALL